MEVAPGTVIQGYSFLKAIGRGGFATVYHVTSVRFGTDYAAKVMAERPTRSDSNSYEAELNALKQLSHPNIILLFDAFEHENRYVLVFELCPHGSLHDEVKALGHGISSERFMEIAHPIIEALAYCHQRGIAHCDIKPSNILIDQYNRPKLADFGIAAIMQRTKARATMGTMEFMAPELLRGECRDRREADIWALGVTFAYLVNGELPWPRERVEMQKAILCGSFKLAGNVPSAISHLIHKMIAPEPDVRWSAERLKGHPAFTAGVRVSVPNFQIGGRRSSLPRVLSGAMRPSAIPDRSVKLINLTIPRRATLAPEAGESGSDDIGA
jgi:serine/threonine protein kinase